MMPISHQNRGFTLTEVLISVVILLVGLLGMFQSINIAMDKNLENQLRQKAVSVAESRMNEIKSRPFANITGTGSSTVRIPVGSVFKTISTAHRVDDISSSDIKSRQISVRVWWSYRNKNYEHQTASGIGDTGGSK